MATPPLPVFLQRKMYAFLAVMGSLNEAVTFGLVRYVDKSQWFLMNEDGHADYRKLKRDNDVTREEFETAAAFVFKEKLPVAVDGEEAAITKTCWAVFSGQLRSVAEGN